MGWFEVIAVIVVVANASLVMVVFEPGDCIWIDKITDKQVPRAARGGGRSFTGWTDNAVFLRAAEQPNRRRSCVIVCRGPFPIVVHRNRFAMVNVLRCRVTQYGCRLAGREESEDSAPGRCRRPTRSPGTTMGGLLYPASYPPRQPSSSLPASKL